VGYEIKNKFDGLARNIPAGIYLIGRLQQQNLSFIAHSPRFRHPNQ
jgi:hypothetical protein